MGLSGNLRIVTIGPFSAIGLMTILTREPLLSLASTIGDASFTTLLHPATICWITSCNFSMESNPRSSSCNCPSLSTKMCSIPLIMISVTELSSTKICRISSLRKESNNSLRRRLRSSTEHSSRLSCSISTSSMVSSTSSSV